jgi:membrane protease YdiL (CAAX protease family)
MSDAGGANDYHFITRWRVDGRPEEVFDVIAEGASLPRWWPSVYLDVAVLEPGDADGVGRISSLHTKGFLPYTLRWRFRATEVLRPTRLALQAQGDFVGRGVWTFTPADGAAGATDVTFDWRIRAEKPLLKAFSFLLKPVFSANHRWAMDRGLESLRLELRRRQAASEEERARVPLPPGPTFPDNLAGSPVAVFLSLTVALSALFSAAIVTAGRLEAGRGLLVTALMWSPGLAALATCGICRIGVGALGWRWGGTRYQLESYLVPFLYSLVAYSLVWLLGLGGVPSRSFLADSQAQFGIAGLGPGGAATLRVLLTASFGFPGSVASALGEEIGWRGLLVPRLHARFGFTTAALLSGLVWTLWHTPILLFADYNAGTPAWFALPCFTVLVVSGATIFAWYRLRSGSLWTAAFLHASHNLFIQSIFTPLTEETRGTRYFIDEFGVVLPLLMALLAWWFWSRRRELPPRES